MVSIVNIFSTETELNQNHRQFRRIRSLFVKTSVFL